MKEYYKTNKSLLWIVLFIILIGSLPIFPTSSTEKVILKVPYTEEKYNQLEYHIEIKENCNSFYMWDDIEQIDLINKYTIQKNNQGTNNERLEKTIMHNFRDYNIGIFAIKTCDDCIDENSLSILDEKTCLMNKTSIFGYFENCSVEISRNYDEYTCLRTPFVVSDNIEIISPDKTFKIELKPFVVKTKIKGDKYNPIINKYYVELIITYPDWKPLPYAKWMGVGLLFVLDPLKSILKYFTDYWLY